MKKTTLLMLAGISLLIASCDSGDKKLGKPIPYEENASNASDPNAVANPSANMPNANAASAPSSASPTINPPHGEPGHRCDIPVGAPLNSAPLTGQINTDPAAQAAAKPAQTQSQPAAATQSPVTTPPGMNPPHGQPGHRCDIPVGSPLDSAPPPAQ